MAEAKVRRVLMTLLLQLRDVATVTVRRGIGAVSETTWQADLVLPTTATKDDASPRAAPAYRLRWAVGWREPPGASLKLGDRVSVRDVTYELITPPRPLRNARGIVGMEADLLPVAELYPLSAIVAGQDGAELATNMPIAVWGGSESHSPTGTYENQEGEAPIEFEDELTTPNVTIVMGSDRLRVTEAVVSRVAPIVALTLRRAGG